MSTALPLCRWRTGQMPNGNYQCLSPRLHVCRDGIPGSFCQDYCAKEGGLCNHEVGPDEKAPPPSYRMLRCVHLGQPTGGTGACRSCRGTVQAKLFYCAKHGTCTPQKQVEGHACCAPGHCEDHMPVDSYYPMPGDPKCGVVIGSYYHVGIIELQIKTLRRYAGNELPILVSDDRSPPGRFEAIKAICEKYRVWFVASRYRRGHALGDLTAFYRGFRWAKKLELDYLCKLSCRMVWYKPRWLHDTARNLRGIGGFVAGFPFDHQEARLPLHTHCLLMDVKKWLGTGAVEEFNPGKPVGYVEGRVCHFMTNHFEGQTLLRWDVPTTNRYRRQWGFVWHESERPSPEQQDMYHLLAAKFGVDLGDLSLGPSIALPGFIMG